jgi:hypothetical protein
MVPEDRKTGEHKNPGAETGAGVFSIEVNDWDPDAPTEVVEPPPEGFGDIKDRLQPRAFRHCEGLRHNGVGIGTRHTNSVSPRVK